MDGSEAVQVSYKILNPRASVYRKLLNIAFTGFNVLRPLGRSNLGLSCGIFGNGFGLSKKMIEQVPFKANSIVEDLEYHINLVEANYKVDFIHSSSVFGEMPISFKTAGSQRVRWEGGRFRMIRKFAPNLFLKVLQGEFRLTEPLLDLLLLPLSYHAFFLFILLFLSGFFQYYAMIGIGIVTLYLVVSCWLGKCLQDLPLLLLSPLYIVWKILITRKIFTGSKKNFDWIRTKRENENKH